MPTKAELAVEPARPPTIAEALAAVMAAVTSVGKGQRNRDQGYNFRGIDDVVNAVGPVLREHKVIGPLPEVLDVAYRDVRTSKDKPAREVTVRVRYRFVGPAGDELTVIVPGESMDSGDKGTAKAMSVAYRIALLQALCLPTDEADPDAHTYERAYAQPARQQPASPQRPAEPTPADEARDALREACTTNGWDAKAVAAAYLLDHGADLKAEPDAEKVKAFQRDLEAAPEQILGLAGGATA